MARITTGTNQNPDSRPVKPKPSAGQVTSSPIKYSCKTQTQATLITYTPIPSTISHGNDPRVPLLRRIRQPTMPITNTPIAMAHTSPASEIWQIRPDMRCRPTTSTSLSPMECTPRVIMPNRGLLSTTVQGINATKASSSRHTAYRVISTRGRGSVLIQPLTEPQNVLPARAGPRLPGHLCSSVSPP